MMLKRIIAPCMTAIISTLLATSTAAVEAVRTEAVEEYVEEQSSDADDATPNWFDSIASYTQFSTKDLLLATTAAAILLAMTQLLGGPGQAAAAMGALAVIGFGLQAAEFRMPRFVILGWWFALAAFCVLTLFSLAGSALGLSGS